MWGSQRRQHAPRGSRVPLWPPNFGCASAPIPQPPHLRSRDALAKSARAGQPRQRKLGSCAVVRHARLVRHLCYETVTNRHAVGRAQMHLVTKLRAIEGESEPCARADQTHATRCRIRGSVPRSPARGFDIMTCRPACTIMHQDHASRGHLLAAKRCTSTEAEKAGWPE